MTGPRPGGFGALNDRTNQICGTGDLICAAPQEAFNITNLPHTLEVLAGGAGQPVHALYGTPQFWNFDGQPATEWTLNWARGADRQRAASEARLNRTGSELCDTDLADALPARNIKKKIRASRAMSWSDRAAERLVDPDLCRICEVWVSTCGDGATRDRSSASRLTRTDVFDRRDGMPFHNPFIKDGRITFPDNGNLVRHVERWAKVRGDRLAYRFLDFSTERDGVERDLNWADFSVRNRAVAARLQQVTQPGDRVAILCPQNLEYLVAFFGTLYAGRIAVPLFDPSEPGHVGRLHAVLDDCTPTAILTTTESAEGVRKFFRSRPAKERPRVIAVDAVPDEVAATWEPVEVDRDTIAYLQYTSGSTRIPTGVQITHLNLATNVVQVIEALEGEEGDRGVTWLPFFHDMGLITALIAADDRALRHLHDAGRVRAPAGPLDPRDGPQARRHRRRHLGGAELRLRPRRRARPAQGRRAAAGPVQRQGHPQRQRADFGGVGAPVQRGVRPVRLPAARRSSRPTGWPRRRCSSPPRRWASRRRSSTSTATS